MRQQQIYSHHERQEPINRANVFNLMDDIVASTLSELNPKPKPNRIEVLASQLASYQESMAQIKRIAVIKQKQTQHHTHPNPKVEKHVNVMDLNYTRRIQSVRRMYKGGRITRVEFDRLCVIWRHLKEQNDPRILPFGRVNRRHQITW